MFERIKRWLRGERTVYKVVRIDGAKKSCIVEGEALTIYAKGIWVSAPDWLAARGYWPTCFKTLEQAKRFWRGTMRHGRPRCEIWECRAKGVKSQLPPICEPNYLRSGKVWPLSSAFWPPGTLMARQLKLVRRIEFRIP